MHTSQSPSHVRCHPCLPIRRCPFGLRLHCRPSPATAADTRPSPMAGPATRYARAASPAGAVQPAPGPCRYLPPLRTATSVPPSPTRTPPDATDLDRLCRSGLATPRRRPALTLGSLVRPPAAARQYLFLIATASSTEEYFQITHF
jgi:hypothetical protein